MSLSAQPELCAALLLCSVIFVPVLSAQEECSVEVKLQLLPGQSRVAVTALKARKESPVTVYFFETDMLDLSSQGVIVRLRRGSSSDLTIKLRPVRGVEFFHPHAGRKDLKCEVDLTGEGAIPSYSITTKLAGERLPATGLEIYQLLSPEQRNLLKEAEVSINWNQVKRIVEIQSTTWQAYGQPDLGRLALELWEWPEGKILELSSRAGPESGTQAYRELQDLASSKRLSLSPDQRTKTKTVLESMANSAGP
jgi:hypothetical protein